MWFFFALSLWTIFAALNQAALMEALGCALAALIVAPFIIPKATHGWIAAGRIVSAFLVSGIWGQPGIGAAPDGIREAAGYRAGYFDADATKSVVVEAKTSEGANQLCRGEQVYCVVMPRAGGDPIYRTDLKIVPPRSCPSLDGTTTVRFYRDPDTGSWQPYPDLNPAMCTTTQ